MTKEKKKSDCLTKALRNSVIVFLVYQHAQLCSAESEIIGSSVVTSVSVILHNNGHGRMNKEVSMEVTTASPSLSPILSDGEPFEDLPVTSLPNDEAASTSTARVPSPVYIHAQPVVHNNAEEDLDEVTNLPVVAAPTTTPAPPPPSPEPSPPSLPVMEEADTFSEGTLEPLPSSRKPSYSTLPPFSLVGLSKSSRRADDDGIRVIDALKDIVRQAQKQHAQNDRPIPSPITLTLTDTAISKSGISGLSFGGLPPVAMPIQEDSHAQKIMPGTGMNGDDDDEMEVEVNAGSLDPAAATTDVIDDFAKVVVMVQADDSEGENDTAPSGEVVHSNKIRMYKSDMIDEITASILCQHRGERADLEECGLDMLVSDAMHKISGAILSNDDVMMNRPVENIVNDVLSSINARNTTNKLQQSSPPSTTTSTTSTTPKPTTTTSTTTSTPRPTTSTVKTTTSTRPTTVRITTTTTTTPRPTTQVRTTPKPTTSTQRTIVTAKTLPPRTSTTQAPRTTPTTVRTTSSTFLPRITPKVTASTTPRPTTTTQRATTTKATTTTRPTPAATQRTTTTLRPRPPQTTESFAYGNLFNSGLDIKTQQTLATIVKKDKPVMYSPDKMEAVDILPPPFQGAPPTSSSSKPSTTTTSTTSTTTSTTTTTEKPMSALEVMIKQAEQMGRPFTPMAQKVPVQEIFDADPPVPPPKFNQQLQQQKPVIPISPSSEPPPTDYRIPGIPVDNMSGDQVAPSQLEDNDSSGDLSAGSGAIASDGVDSQQSGDNELEHEEFDGDSDTDTETPLKPYIPPIKKPILTFMEKKPVNESTSSKRPNEFYDDEIFGFDPYQTFHHGVYVPLVEVIQPLEDRQDSSSEEMYVPPPTSKPKRRKRPRPTHVGSNNNGGGVRPFVKQGKPSRPRPSSVLSNGHYKNSKKPVPSLPDYLHRPRPSHLQYQHGAADDTDPLTGLLNPNYKHPGQGYGPETQTFAPDRLLAIPPQTIPHSVRKNLTDHHDQHYQHQHGLVVPGHGHGHSHGGGGGGGHGHEAPSTAHVSSSQVPNQPSNHLTSDQPVVEKRPDFGPAPPGNPGLEATLTSVDPEMRSFVDINNRIALRLFSSLTNPVSKSSTSYGNMVVSPFTITSSLSMLFLGARGNTASQLDGLLRLDDMLTFNPHMMYHNITQAFLSQPNTAAAMIRLLIADKGKGDILDFYRTRVQHFYDARVEQADYKFAGHLAQSIINQMIRAQIQRHSYELLNYSIPLSGPMSLITATFFDGQFAGTRDPKLDGMNFIHLAALGRRLFPVPALSVKGNFRATYDNNLDATAVEIPYTSRDLSLIVMMPGKPGEFSIGGVASLKSKLTLESWTQLMRGFYPRDSFKVVLPRFRHQTATNLTYTLKRFGLTDLFVQEQAKFKGINGLVDLFVDENMMHFTEFATWEKLSDTMRENSAQNNKNLDLIRILRPYVKDQYGQYNEPLSVNDWISMSRNPQQSPHQHRAQGEQRSRGPHNPPQSAMDIRLALRLAHAEEKMKRRQAANGARSNTNPRLEPMRSFMRPKGKKSKSHGSSSGGHRRHSSTHDKNKNKNKLYARQEPGNNGPELEERVLKFERPFIYLLRHNPTGMILMTGQYTEPVTEVLE